MTALAKALLIPVWAPLAIGLGAAVVACILLRWALDGVMLLGLWWLELIAEMLGSP